MDVGALKDEYRAAAMRPAGVEKARLLRTILEFMARTDPMLAISFALESQGNERANNLAGVLTGWGSVSPDAALSPVTQ
jgi:hypothetical protein